MSENTRRASHAGAWYSANENELRTSLTQHLSAASMVPMPPDEPCTVRGIICPHAGYSYSARTAAHSYKHMQLNGVKRIFLLGPSHHVYIDGCALPVVSQYETPFGNLIIDSLTVNQLRMSGKFVDFKRNEDEDEHSIEMQLPFIKLLLDEQQLADTVTIVPIIVGNVSFRKEQMFGQLLAPYFDNPENFFVVSSDFCHWGNRFRYTFHDEKLGKEVHDCISRLDHLGMEAIETLSPKLFDQYISTTKNTICGRHPISVFLCAVEASKVASRVICKEAHYAQSSRVTSLRDSSVSYGSLVFMVVH